MEQFVLASASPRRKELMKLITDNFSIVVPEVDESKIDSSCPPNIYVEELALLKAAATAKLVLKQRDALIISADTIVVKNNEILTKPKDRQDAFRILAKLSGEKHFVYTGFCIMRISDGFTYCGYNKTTVKFSDLTENKINAYIETGEPMDKAGAYGIQGKGARFVEKIEGDYFNVVGFPVCAIVKALETEFDVTVI